MTSPKLTIGMPAGSLADSKRGGNLVHLLEDAGFTTTGYDSGGPSKFTGVTYLYGWDGRPQEFGSQLGISELDIAIAGDDWIQERILEFQYEYGETLPLEKVLSLKRGGVLLVGIIDPANGSSAETTEEYLKEIGGKKKLITVATEMPYLALEWVRDKLKAVDLLDAYPQYSVQKYKTPPKIEEGIIIYETWGKTEAKIKNGGADLGMEITQSGSAIRNYGLKIIDTIMASETSIWINPEIKKDDAKKEIMKMFLLNLYGTIYAQNKVLLLFNVPNSKCADIDAYLTGQTLFGDEPTINPGKNFTEYAIQIETGNRDCPISRVRYDLATKGAKSIDTIPLRSSIPNIDVLGF